MPVITRCDSFGALVNLIPRPALVDMILSAPSRVVVLEAAAGMGKSTLLAMIAEQTGLSVHHGLSAPVADGPLTLWDVPDTGTPSTLPEACLAGSARIVVAKRPSTDIAGLARAVVYGGCQTLCSHDLLFTLKELAARVGKRRAAEVIARTGGWPVLMNPAAYSDPASLVTFIAVEILGRLGDGDLVTLHRALRAGKGAPGLVPDLPLDRGHPVQPPLSVIAPLRAAVGHEIENRIQSETCGCGIADAFAMAGLHPEAIDAYQRLSLPDLALQVLSKGPGDFLVHIYGSAAFDRVLSGFDPEFARRHETLVICTAMQALKRGDLPLARRAVRDHLGDDANDPALVFSHPSPFSARFRAFRLVMLIYEDVPLTDLLLKQAFDLLDEHPVDAHLTRGSIYNSVLEFYIRSHRFAEADDLARRARFHYEQARVPLLCFYISVHQAIIALMAGDPAGARRAASAADAELHSVAFDSPSDVRLLALLQACIDYETGRVEPLARFLSLELDDFSRGEIWPSLIELTLQYGSLALGEHYSTLAARSFLDRWRVYQMRNRQFADMIDLRETVVLQNGNRWQEAAARLGAMPGRISRTFVLAATDELSRLSDRDELAVALVWLRLLTFEGPTRAGLAEKLLAILGNLNLSARQRIGVEVWLAHVYRRQRNPTAARAMLLKTFETVSRLGAIAPLAEERPFLSDLLANERIASFLDASPIVRNVLRKMRDAGPALDAATRKGGLTRQEARILQSVCEGASNKFIANVLGVSEATVKFHLGNVYRKLGCQTRKQAMQAAASLGLMT